jgi:hypothetical protein
MTHRFIVKRFCGHVEREDVHVDFLFQFFDILKFVKYSFQNKESICSQEPEHHSLIRMTDILNVLIDAWPYMPT